CPGEQQAMTVGVPARLLYPCQVSIETSFRQLLSLSASDAHRIEGGGRGFSDTGLGSNNGPCISLRYISLERSADGSERVGVLKLTAIERQLLWIFPDPYIHDSGVDGKRLRHPFRFGKQTNNKEQGKVPVVLLAREDNDLDSDVRVL
ncbi:hypothetical protein BaRGS_00000081, partial [Batillaria attramentaria]